MVKHNNVLPNGHFHKDWDKRVKMWFDQPGKKKSRRLARKAKLAKISPAPLQKLRPVVHCPTQRYNHRTRLGRGFSLMELKEAGITANYAKSVGITVDSRRTNNSAESVTANVNRLKEYISKLVIFGRSKKGGSSAADKAAVPSIGSSKPIMPIVKETPVVEFASVTDDMKEFSAYQTVRASLNDAKMIGIREKMSKEKDEKKK